MSKWLPTLLFSLILLGCTSSPSVRLQDINPTRSYNTGYDQVLDAIRMFAVREGYKLDRFETEYGTIIGHKTDSGGSRRTGMDAMSQVIVMKLSVKRQTAQRTDLNASFSFGGVHTTSTKEDEDILVYNYTSLFDYLGDALK
ncbi:MAG: hypothetical protein H6Q30_1730 [Bacteroidetes bacterium]|nr:hypothetical protein [Bacteroidota bacterium]